MRRQTSRPPRLRKQDLPGEVPETRPEPAKPDPAKATPAPEAADDPSEEAIRKMVEAAYT